MKKIIYAFGILVNTLSMAHATTPWARHTQTLENHLNRYDSQFQKFAKVTANMIAVACRQPGDLIPRLITPAIQGTFSLPARQEEECQGIREKGFEPICIQLESSSIPYIEGFHTWNVAWPNNYYQSLTWIDTFKPVALAFTCTFGPNKTFRQFYVGPASMKWQSSGSYGTRIQTANGPIEANNRTLHIYSNIPSFQGKTFETWITAVTPQQ